MKKWPIKDATEKGCFMKKFIIITVLAFSFNNLSVMADEIEPETPVEIQLMMADDTVTNVNDGTQEPEELMYTTGEEMQTTSVDDANKEIKTTSEDLSKKSYTTVSLDEEKKDESIIYYAGGGMITAIAGFGIYLLKKNNDKQK